jgi:phenylpyruvate tautomerase PptA (4-oxalocrotonate tautomerase family)
MIPQPMHGDAKVPVFKVHIPAGRFSSEQKRGLADALNQALVQGLGIPEGDRFIIISEHGEDELFLHPTCMDIHRGPDAMIITVLFGAQRPLEDKRKVTSAINRLVSDALGVSPDDIFLALIPEDPVVSEIRTWFFCQYVAKWVSIGASKDGDPRAILQYWGVPMHASSPNMNRAHNAGLSVRTTGRWTTPTPLPQFDAICADGSTINLDDLHGSRVAHHCERREFAAAAVNAGRPRRHDYFSLP